MSLPRLFAMFIAFSLLFAPLAMNRAMAAMPVSHSQVDHGQAGKAGHCQQSDDGAAKTSMHGKPCCAAMCATVAVVPQATASDFVFARMSAVAALASIHRAVLSEIATPPPRAA